MEFHEGCANDRRLFHPMSFVECDTSAQRSGKSWKNESEAKMIAQWIFEKKEMIERFYSTKDKAKTISELIAIVTPYSAQIPIIKEAIAEVFDEAKGKRSENYILAS